MSINLQKMTEAEYEAYRIFLNDLYAGQTQRAYGWDSDKAVSYSHQVLNQLIADGFKTKNTFFFNIVEESSVVGGIWLALEEEEGQQIAFLRYIHVEEQYQGKNISERALEKLKIFIKNDLDISQFRLNVYGYNKGAIHIYEKAGLEPLKVTMAMRLG